jgi:cellulose synthase/poly-beta-1,6-N-acetylglucosamine synthase-like glycosyltransferase
VISLSSLALRRIESDPAPDPLLTPAPDQAPAPQGVPNREVLDPGLIDSSQSATGVDWGSIAGYSGLVAIALALTLIAVTTLWWMLYAWRSKSTYDSTAFSKEPRAPQHTFTLLVPGRHEEEVMGQTLDALAAQTHPDVQIIAIVGDDDPGTTAVVRAAAERHPDRIEVVVDDSVPKNKPKALNRALPYAGGSIIGVFDAEDEVHPELLRHIDSRFTETGATVVQGGVQLMNFRSSWWSLRNVLEYYFLFRSRLHFHAGAKFIPLGGNTVFVKRDALEYNDGWDAECLAEDCELGVRLSSQGEKVVVAYSPEYVTREETPGTLKSFYKQRTRWNQGFLQVLRKGEWRALPTRGQRLFARYMLAMPFLQAATGLLIPLSVFLILVVKVPTVVALLTFIPLAPTIVTVAVEVAGLGEFGRLYGQKVRPIDYVRLVLGTIPFQVLLAGAALRAVFRELRGERGWEKTEHTGAHRDDDTTPIAASPTMTAQEVAA